MGLTKEDFENALHGLATKDDRKGLATQSSVEKVLAFAVNTHEDEALLKEEAASIREAVNRHTGALADVAVEVKNWKPEVTVMRSRVDRILQQFAEKVGVALDFGS